MTFKEAAEILENEVLCAQTRDAGCGRKCEDCHIRIKGRDKYVAYGKAIRALQQMKETEHDGTT